MLIRRSLVRHARPFFLWGTLVVLPILATVWLLSAWLLPRSADAQPVPADSSGLVCTAISNTSIANSSETILAANPRRVEYCILVDPANTVALHLDLFGTESAAGTAETTDPKFPANVFSSICDTLDDGKIYKYAITGRSSSGTAAITGWECTGVRSR